MDSGNIAWVLVSTALVLFMTPGLAFFYGGMVRSKNFLTMLMQNFFAIGLLAVLWAILGASIAFGNLGDGGWIGDFSLFGLTDVGAGVNADGVGSLFGLSIPDSLFIAYQMTFAIITPALITGATADRLKFAAYALFIGIWLVLIYGPVAHWAFGGGWIAKMGALDFAGGLVVHINAGAAALAVLIVLGVRKGYKKEPMPPHALPWTLLGTGILWFGWFGFNAGSALAADGIASQALLNTLVAPAAAMLGWLLVEKIKGKHVTTLGAASGAVAGLVAITPCAGFVGSMPAIIIGFAAGVVCYLALFLKEALKLDDALDVLAVHLVGGLLGSIMLGLFADSAVNPFVTADKTFDGKVESGFKNGLFIDGGNANLLVDQIVAALAVFAFAFVGSFAIAKVLDLVVGLRVDEETEDIGLDQVLHAETAYTNL